MRVRFSPEAEADFRNAYEWYEEQSPGLGSRFRSAVDSTVSRIASHPKGHPIVLSDARRALVRPFPYSLLYIRHDDEIVVVACFHASREPKKWTRRLDDD